MKKEKPAERKPNNLIVDLIAKRLIRTIEEEAEKMSDEMSKK